MVSKKGGPAEGKITVLSCFELRKANLEGLPPDSASWQELELVAREDNGNGTFTLTSPLQLCRQTRISVRQQEDDLPLQLSSERDVQQIV